MSEVCSHGPGVDHGRRRTESERVGTRGRPTNSAALAVLPVEPKKFPPLLANKATARSDISRYLNADLDRVHVSYAKYLAVCTNIPAPGFPISGALTCIGSPGSLRAPHPVEPRIPFHFYWLMANTPLIESVIHPRNCPTKSIHTSCSLCHF